RVLDLFLVQLACTIQRRLDELHLAILQGDVEALERGPCSDIAAHHACTADVHMLDAVLDAAALRFQTLLQEEHADQVLRGRCRRQLGDRLGLQLQALVYAAATSAPYA